MERKRMTTADLLRLKQEWDQAPVISPTQQRIRYCAEMFLRDLRYEKHLCKEYSDILAATDPLQAAMDYIEAKVFPSSFKQPLTSL